jgi:hypothetical protein
MAKDFDFRRPTPSARPVIQAEKTISGSTNTPDKSPKRKKMGVPFLVSLIVFGAVIVGLYYYYQSLQAPQLTESNSTSSQSEAKTTESTQVTIYDRGFGKTKLDLALQTLKSNGMNVDIGSGESLTYTTSYLFYNASLSTQAHKIVELFPLTKFTLRETPLPGISVYFASK